MNQYLSAEDLAHRLEKPKKQGKGWQACCPAHEDNNPSLSINDGDNGKPVVHCHAGCTQKSVIDTLIDAGKWPERNPNGASYTPQKSRKTVYSYFKANGDLAFTVERIDKPDGSKEIRPRLLSGKSQWYPAPRPLYRLPELIERKDAPVLIVEGEKTVGAAEMIFRDHIVITTSGGSSHHEKSNYEPLQGRNVVIWPDADEPGMKYADNVARHATKAGAESVRIVQLPEGKLREGWDLADNPPVGLNVRELLDGALPWTDSEAETAKPIEVEHKDAEALALALDTLGVKLRYDMRAHQSEMSRGGRVWKEMTDRNTADLRRDIARRFECRTTRGTVPLHYGSETWKTWADAILFRNEIDPFVEWLKGREQWDGIERINHWLSEVYELDSENDPALAEWVSRFIFLGAVTRAFYPGAKLDEMPVLIGPQGIGKSTALRWALPDERPDWFADGLHLAGSTKDRAEALQGRVIVEASEMAGSTHAELESLKAFISRTDDGSVRLSYRRDPETLLRRCIIVGTTNEPQPLPNDASGNRRFVPVILKDGNPQKIREYLHDNRSQLWAEATEYYHAGQEARFPDKLKRAQSSAADKARRGDEILENAVETWLSDNEMNIEQDGFELHEVAQGVEMVRAGESATTLPMGAQKGLGAVLLKQGYSKKQEKRDGANKKIWRLRP